MEKVERKGGKWGMDGERERREDGVHTVKRRFSTERDREGEREREKREERKYGEINCVEMAGHWTRMH